MRLKVETDSEHKANRNSLIIKCQQESRAGFSLASTRWEAAEEPIHYCCALWINCVWVYEILKLCFTLRNKKRNQTVSYSTVKYIVCIHHHKNRTSPGVLVGVWADSYQWDVAVVSVTSVQSQTLRFLMGSDLFSHSNHSILLVSTSNISTWFTVSGFRHLIQTWTRTVTSTLKLLFSLWSFSFTTCTVPKSDTEFFWQSKMQSENLKYNLTFK